MKAAFDLVAASLLALGLAAPLGRLGPPFALLFALALFAAERALDILLHVPAAWLLAPLGVALLKLNSRPIELPATADPFPGRARLLLRAVGIGAMAVALALFVEHSIRWPDGDWDAWGNWNMRARFFHRGGTADAFSPHLWHSDYPFLVPAAVAQAWDLLGRETKAAPAAIALLWSSLACAIAAMTAARFRGATAGWLTAGLIAATPWYVILAWNQYADLPLGAFFVAAAALIAFSAEREDWRLPLLAGLNAGFGAFCKNDGLLAVAALGVAAVAARRRARDALAFAAGALPMLLLLAVHKRTTTARNDFADAFSVSSLRGVVDPARWAIIGDEALLYLLDVREWGPMLLAVPPAVVLAWRAPRDAAARPIGAAVALLALAYLAVYATTPLDLRWHVHGSFDRLIGQLWPSLLLWLMLSLAPRR